MNGWGVFSTVKVVDGVLFAFPRHWARMHRDAELLRVGFPWAPAQLESELLRLVEANHAHNSTMRIVVVRNRGGMWESPGLDRDLDLIAFTTDRRDWGGACRLGIVPNARFAANPFSGAKVTSWAMNLVYYEQAHVRGLDEVLLLNERQEVSECTSANLFAIQDPDPATGVIRVLTPPLSAGCLPGVTRDLLLEAIRLPGIEVREQTLTLDDLECAAGLFISSSTRALLPVAEIEGISIRTESDVTGRLLHAYLDYERQYVSQKAAQPS
ncbi:MAG: aminotransferase class IV [Solibacteraceae bacterium]|nr:aminotransferase class IV [Solibacteraceae bacterium]